MQLQYVRNGAKSFCTNPSIYLNIGAWYLHNNENTYQIDTFPQMTFLVKSPIIFQQVKENCIHPSLLYLHIATNILLKIVPYGKSMIKIGFGNVWEMYHWAVRIMSYRLLNQEIITTFYIISHVLLNYLPHCLLLVLVWHICQEDICMHLRSRCKYSTCGNTANSTLNSAPAKAKSIFILFK